MVSTSKAEGWAWVIFISAAPEWPQCLADKRCLMRIFRVCCFWMSSENFRKYCWCLGKYFIRGVSSGEIFEHNWKLLKGTWQTVYFINIINCLGIGTISQLWCLGDQRLKLPYTCRWFQYLTAAQGAFWREGHTRTSEYLLNTSAFIPPKTPKFSSQPLQRKMNGT